MTYPKVSEIKRHEWGPEQIAATYAEALAAAEAAGAPNPKACADRYLQGTELRMRLETERVCPKR